MVHSGQLKLMKNKLHAFVLLPVLLVGVFAIATDSGGQVRRMVHAVDILGLVPRHRSLYLLLLLLSDLTLQIGHVTRIHGVVKLTSLLCFTKLRSLCMELLCVSSTEVGAAECLVHLSLR